MRQMIFLVSLTTVIASCVSLGLVAGCGGGTGRPKTVPVSGTITYKGQPVANAEVNFRDPKSPRAATGRTDKNGYFRLTTFDTNDGATPGEHTITITKVKALIDMQGETAETPGPAYGKAMEAAANPGEDGKSALVSHELPEKYSQDATSGLKRTVADPGPNDFKIDLTD